MNAIWSHRWYAFSNGAGSSGPNFNKLGGVPLGNSGIWIGDYTTEPENGGLGVFTHEFGHDLGLPDLYDTNPDPNVVKDNGTGFWTLMSGGSWLNRGKDAIGTTPGYMGAWEKLQLGWLDYKTVDYGKTTQVWLGAANKAYKQQNIEQAVIVNLPDKSKVTKYNSPHGGASEWWSGSADNLTSTLTRTVDLTGRTSASLSAWLWADIEEDYDFLYLDASTDGGASWTQVGDPITGSPMTWGQINYDLSAFAGKSTMVRFRYATDGGVHLAGAFIDDITITADGATLVTDGAENGDNGWTANGFSRINGTVTSKIAHYYIAENRVYSDYDSTLRTGPYNFGYTNTKPLWVERFPYQNGMLVWYIDGAYEDNNTSQHAGHGMVLPVDARPANIVFPDGVKLGNRRQPFDATFGLERTDSVTFHRNGVPLTVKSSPAIPTFNDSNPNRYWDPTNPLSSTIVAGTNTSISVQSDRDHGDLLNVKVSFKKKS